MTAHLTTTTGGALLSALAAISTPGTIRRCRGILLHHTGDANVVVLDGTDGVNFWTLKVTDEMQCASVIFPDDGYPLTAGDIYYTLSAGTAIFLIE